MQMEGIESNFLFLIIIFVKKNKNYNLCVYPLTRQVKSDWGVILSAGVTQWILNDRSAAQRKKVPQLASEQRL